MMTFLTILAVGGLLSVAVGIAVVIDLSSE